jgi:tRNA pseudouridine38-40 synthase
LRYFIDLSYNGTNFHGWQVQPNAVTVQSLLNGCLSTLLKEEINCVGAGRTDTGVHAKQMIAHFDCEETFNSKNLVSKLNAFLPKDIAVRSIRRFNLKHMQDLMQKKEHMFIKYVPPRMFLNMIKVIFLKIN